MFENVNAILFAKMEEIHEEIRNLKSESKPKLLTPYQKCKELNKSRSTLWRYVRDGKIEPTYVAGKPYFKSETL